MTPTLAEALIAAALLAGALLWYARWRRTGDALPLITSAFAAGIGGLARYDLFIVGWALSAFTLVGPRARPWGKRDERSAYAIAYAAAVTGVLGLWLVTALVTTGDPFAFARRTLLEDIVTAYAVRQVSVR